MRATHILAILLYNSDKFQNKNWLESGLDYNDSQKFVDIKEVSNSLNYVDCIPGIYSSTGIYNLSSFHGTGKTRKIKLMNLHGKKYWYL